jgi:VanZ family protein
MIDAPRTLSLAGLWNSPRWRPAWRLLLLALLLFVGVMALSPVPPVDVGFSWDKLNHSAAFAALTVTGLRAFPQRSAAWPLFIGLFLFGGAIELLQLMVPGRSAEWFDLAGDTLGIAAAALVTPWVTRWLERGGR